MLFLPLSHLLKLHLIIYTHTAGSNSTANISSLFYKPNYFANYFALFRPFHAAIRHATSLPPASPPSTPRQTPVTRTLHPRWENSSLRRRNHLKYEKKFISRAEIYISAAEMYISNREIYISAREMNFRTEHIYSPPKT